MLRNSVESANFYFEIENENIKFENVMYFLKDY